MGVELSSGVDDADVDVDVDVVVVEEEVEEEEVAVAAEEVVAWDSSSEDKPFLALLIV